MAALVVTVALMMALLLQAQLGEEVFAVVHILTSENEIAFCSFVSSRDLTTKLESLSQRSPGSSLWTLVVASHLFSIWIWPVTKVMPVCVAGGDKAHDHVVDIVWLVKCFFFSHLLHLCS